MLDYFSGININLAIHLPSISHPFIIHMGVSMAMGVPQPGGWFRPENISV